jgi:membrane-bound lytic murein transglycosylase A
MIFSLLLFVSFGLHAQEITPTVAVNQSLDFADDMDFENLDLAIERQLASNRYRNLSGTIRFGSRTYQRTVLRDSLLLLRQLANDAKGCLETGLVPESCMVEFNREINRRFDIYRPVPAQGEQGHNSRGPARTHFTSYYSPDMTGSRVRTARFSRAIYAMPSNPKDLNLSRVQIDYDGALEGKGLELFYVEDSFFDLYLLHVQGGGRIKVYQEDGTFEIKYLSYAGRNTRPFRMIYHYMRERGYLKGDASVPAQRRFLQENPHLEREIFESSPSYIFFKESDEEPLGIDSIPLTEGRSLAIDVRIYKTSGLINFVKAVRPSHVDSQGRVVKTPFSRFYIAQDTGGAIRGNARCDLYAGYGPLAELAAYNTNDLGEQYFLIRK